MHVRVHVHLMSSRLTRKKVNCQYMSKNGTVGEKAWRSRRTRVTERIVEPGTLHPRKNFLAPILIRGSSCNIYCNE